MIDKMSLKAHEEPQIMAMKEHVYYCFRVLEIELGIREQDDVVYYDGPDASYKCPVFVTWDKREGRRKQLRGCVGTFAKMPLREGLHEYAIYSSMRDGRFKPIVVSELPTLECTVSLLTDFEDVIDPLDFAIGKHGVTVEIDGRWRATFLPKVAKQEGWGHFETLQHLVRKSNCPHELDDELMKKIRVTRYQNKTVSCTYHQFKEHQQK